MEIELIEAWIKINAPESIRGDLIEGAKMLRRNRLKEKSRREQFPNEGNLFTDAESARIMELDSELRIDAWSWERDREIEQEFGRPLKSIKGRLRRMKAKAI
jgi:hypothetical protein